MDRFYTRALIATQKQGAKSPNEEGIPGQPVAPRLPVGASLRGALSRNLTCHQPVVDEHHATFRC